MKQILLLLAVAISSSAFAQTITVTEKVEAIDGVSRNSLSVMIPDAETDDVKKAWKKQLKDLKGKVNDKTVIFGDDCKSKEMGENTFDVYSIVEEATDAGVRLVVAFDLGGAYLSTADHPAKYPAAEQIVKGFAVEQTKAVVREEIEVSAKILKTFEKDFSGLEKDKAGLEKDIADYEKKIEEAKANIEKNLAAQANKKTEIEGIKATIMELEAKEKGIK